MKHIMLAMPAYTGVVHMGTMRSPMTDCITLIKRGDRFTFVDDVGNAMIADCRGVITTNFYHSDCDELVFIDSDVAWEAGALCKLIDHPVDFVAGAYPARVDPLKFNIGWIEERKYLKADPNTGLLEVDRVPTGFLKITKNCVAKMIEAYPETFYHDAAVNNQFYPLYESFIDPEKKWKYGEDFSFCKRWREIGGQVWLDPEINMGHIGNKIFEGHIGNWLKSRIISQLTSEVTHEPNQNS
jgi:hypothetical protein